MHVRNGVRFPNGFMLYDLANDPGEQENLIVRGGAGALEQNLRDALLRRLVGAHDSL